MINYIKDEYWIDDGGDGFYVAFNARNDEDIKKAEPIVLNESAYCILRLCDVKNNEENILEELSREYDLNSDSKMYISECIRTLLINGLIKKAD